MHSQTEFGNEKRETPFWNDKVKYYPCLYVILVVILLKLIIKKRGHYASSIFCDFSNHPDWGRARLIFWPFTPDKSIL